MSNLQISMIFKELWPEAKRKKKVKKEPLGLDNIT
jgi:hypothetical protein